VDKNSKKKLMMISLDGLLDYDETDKLEATFELSLFGELFHYMLQRDFGYVIYQALHDAKEKNKDKKVAKRAREDAGLDAHSSSKKLKAEEVVKSEDTTAADNATPMDTTPAAPIDLNEGVPPEENKETEAHEKESEQKLEIDDPVVDMEEEKKGDSKVDEESKEIAKLEDTKTDSDKVDNRKVDKDKVKEEKENEEEPVVTTKRVTDESVLAAFRYFDRTAIGYIRDDDLELIVHNLGLFQCKRVVHSLVAAVGTEYSAKSCRVYYERIAEKEVPIEDNVGEQ